MSFCDISFNRKSGVVTDVLNKEGRESALYPQLVSYVQQDPQTVYDSKKEYFDTLVDQGKLVEGKVKEGVDFVFNENPELAKIGSKDQYSQYLDSVFPDSKVKDIVYRGDKSKQINGVIQFLKGERKDLLFLSNNKEVAKNRLYHSDFSEFIYKKDEFGNLTMTTEYEPDELKGLVRGPKNFIAAVVNIQKPLVKNAKNQPYTDYKIDGKSEYETIKDAKEKIRNQENDSLIVENVLEGDVGRLPSTNIGLSKPEQIHILGSKEDIEGFKSFVQQQKVAPLSPDELALGLYSIAYNSGVSEQEFMDRINRDGNLSVFGVGGQVGGQEVNKTTKNIQDRLFQETGKNLKSLSTQEIDNLQSSVEYQLLNEKDEELPKKGGQSYVFLNQKDAKRFSFLVEKNKEFPQTFRITRKITKYERDIENPIKFNPYNVYRDFEYVKVNKNKKSNLYNIVDLETGEIIAANVRVLQISKDAKSEIASNYGLEFTPTKVFSANRSISFAIYRQKPSKAKYIAQAKKYLYDAIKFLNPEESSLKINLDQIEKLLESFPDEMWDYINTTYSPEDSTNINASIGLQNNIKFELPKLGLLTEIEKTIGKKLQGVSFKNYDRSGAIKKILRVEWGEPVTIDYRKMTTNQLRIAISYYLKSIDYFKKTSEEENVKKYAEHKGIDYNKLNELVFGDFDEALKNISYNETGNSDTIELSKWRESIRNYDWQIVELFSKPYIDFSKTAKERIIEKFKDKTLSNGISHLDYFFSGNFNWLNINFNNVSGQYYAADMETKSNVGVEKETKGIINPFEMRIYTKPKAGKDFLREEEVFNRLAAILHEPFHALHALSYGTKEELELRKAFDNLYKTDFGREMMNQVFGSGYNQNQKVSYDVLYKEFTAFVGQLILYPKEWIKKTDLRSNDIYEFFEKVQTLQDKTYQEIIKTQQKIGTAERIITQEEKAKLTFLEKLYNFITKALRKIIPLSKQFLKTIPETKLVSKTIIEDVFGEVEEVVTKELKLPGEIKKSKEEFLQAMEEFKSAINTLMQIDSQLFSSENTTNFFTSGKQYQETGIDKKISNLSKEEITIESDAVKFLNSLKEKALNESTDKIIKSNGLLSKRLMDINQNLLNTKIEKSDTDSIAYNKETNSIDVSKLMIDNIDLITLERLILGELLNSASIKALQQNLVKSEYTSRINRTMVELAKRTKPESKEAKIINDGIVSFIVFYLTDQDFYNWVNAREVNKVSMQNNITKVISQALNKSSLEPFIREQMTEYSNKKSAVNFDIKEKPAPKNIDAKKDYYNLVNNIKTTKVTPTFAAIDVQENIESIKTTAKDLNEFYGIDLFSVEEKETGNVLKFDLALFDKTVNENSKMYLEQIKKSNNIEIKKEKSKELMVDLFKDQLGFLTGQEKKEAEALLQRGIFAIKCGI